MDRELPVLDEARDQRSRFLELTERSAASGDENARDQDFRTSGFMAHVRLGLHGV